MADGGPNRRWFSFDPKYERFTTYNLPPTHSGNATGNTIPPRPGASLYDARFS
jgi:hypothetical protein